MSADRGDHDAGNGFSYSFYRHDDEDGSEHLAGVLQWHGCPNIGGDQDRPGAIPFDIPSNAHVPPAVRWQVEQLDPLTLRPSILCTACGYHGFLTAGRFETC